MFGLVVPDPMKAQIFSYLVLKLREFAFSCERNPDFETGSKKEIQKAYNVLKKDIKEINFFLNELVPKAAKHNRESQFLRLCRKMPDFLVWIIDDYYTPKLRAHILLSYKGQTLRSKDEDVEKFWKAEFKGKCPKKIDTSSEVTIIAYCLAAKYGGSAYKLTNLYYEARKHLKKSNKVN